MRCPPEFLLYLRDHADVAQCFCDVLQDVETFLSLARRLRTRVAYCQRSTVSTPPASLPTDVLSFLCACLEMEESTIALFWDIFKGVVWSAPAVEAHQQYLPFFLRHGLKKTYGSARSSHCLLWCTTLTSWRAQAFEMYILLSELVRPVASRDNRASLQNRHRATTRFYSLAMLDLFQSTMFLYTAEVNSLCNSRAYIN
jgi:hypothetical protein